MFGRKRKLGDFSAEIEAHIQLEIERLREQGLHEEEARAAARRSFGNVTQAQERVQAQPKRNRIDHISGNPTTIRGHSVEGADIVERNG